MYIRHSKVATSPDLPDVEINKAEWNEAHIVEPLIEVLTEDKTITSADIGKTFTNLGATGVLNVTLPASEGFYCDFVVSSAQELRIIADTGDLIYDGNTVSTSGGYIKSSKKGSTLSLICFDADDIFIRNSKGDWRIG